jgi:hypothetical protein
MENPVLVGIVAWLIPGAGHFAQKRIKRGLIIAAVFWVMFIVAVISGGAYYPGFDFKDGQLLYLLNVFARMGNGLGAAISWIIAASPMPDVAARATFEYGGRLLEIAGLINFLAVMDSIDISLGRKK